MPRNCPLCGEPLEDGLCLSCGYDAHLDGDLSIGGKGKPTKKQGSLIDDLLGILSSDGDDPLI